MAYQDVTTSNGKIDIVATITGPVNKHVSRHDIRYMT